MKDENNPAAAKRRILFHPSAFILSPSRLQHVTHGFAGGDLNVFHTVLA